MNTKLIKQSFLVTVTVILTILGAYIFYRLMTLIIILVLAMLLTIVMEPLVKRVAAIRFMNRPIGRGVGAFVSFSMFILVFLIVLIYGLTPLFSQVQKLFFIVAEYVRGLTQDPNIPTNFSDLVSKIPSVSGGVFSLTTSALSTVTVVVFTFFIAIYMSADWPNLKKRFLMLFDRDQREAVNSTINEIETSLAHWIKGQLILMLIVGFLSFIGLLIIDMDYPLALALISGLFEIVPMLGPIMTAILAIIVGLTDSYAKAFAALVVFLIIQQMENNVIVPKVMQRVSGFSPLVIMIAMFIGGAFFGVVGTITTVPIVMIGVVVFKHIFVKK